MGWDGVGWEGVGRVWVWLGIRLVGWGEVGWVGLFVDG